MNASLLKQELKQRGISQLKIAQDLGKSPAAISLVLSGKSRSKRIEEHVARLLGRERFDIWNPTRSVEPDDLADKENRLYQRFLAVVKGSPTTHLVQFSGGMDVLSLEALVDGLNSVRKQPFMVKVSTEDDSEAEQRVNQWLDTPNPMFADKCPRLYLTGSDEEQLFLEKVITSFEHFFGL